MTLNTKPLRFLHIPKTAGTTFLSILRRQYFGKKSFAFTGDVASDIKRFEALSERDKTKVMLFAGHAPIVSGVKMADNATTITFLRDPINRIKSFCQHVAEGKSLYLIDEYPPETFNLDSFLESGNEELSNFQTKMLIGNGSYALPDNMSDRKAADLALDNLFNKISYFGLQEYFDESLMVFSSALHWRMPIYASKNKKNIRKGIQFEKHHLEKIAALNAIDLAVYRSAKEYFVRMLNGVTFDEAKLKWFQFMTKLCRPVIQIEELIFELTKRCTGRIFRFP
ncbi:MAG: hypothetical protein HCAMLNBO_01507 [Candidatus Brocadia fulgida]|nr:hypothetical protein [Candidatus Brocadia fulgida]